VSQQEVKSEKAGCEELKLYYSNVNKENQSIMKALQYEIKELKALQSHNPKNSQSSLEMEEVKISL